MKWLSKEAVTGQLDSREEQNRQYEIPLPYTKKSPTNEEKISGRPRAHDVTRNDSVSVAHEPVVH